MTTTVFIGYRTGNEDTYTQLLRSKFFLSNGRYVYISINLDGDIYLNFPEKEEKIGYYIISKGEIVIYPQYQNKRYIVHVRYILNNEDSYNLIKTYKDKRPPKKEINKYPEKYQILKYGSILEKILFVEEYQKYKSLR